MPVTVAEVRTPVAIPRQQLANDLDWVEYQLFPAVMSRAADPEFRDVVHLCVAATATHVARLKAGLEAGESDEALEQSYLQFLLYTASCEHWRDAQTRWPAPVEGEPHASQ